MSTGKNVQPLSMGPMHLSNLREYEIQRTNNFELVLDEFGNWFTLSVESCPLPTITNSAIELAYGNSKVKVAGQAEFDQISLVVKDAIELDVEYQLWQWRKQVYDPETDKIGWAADYKKNGYIYQYAPDGTCARGWRMLGIWPENFESGEMNYDGGDKKNITMSLNVDKAWPDSEGRTVRSGNGSTKIPTGQGNYTFSERTDSTVF